jgi:hypothetical protein
MYARERDVHMLRVERGDRVHRVASLLSYDLEAPELAAYLVKNRAQVVRVDGGDVWVGRRRSEMGTRAYQLDPLAFTQAVQAAGCAIRW